MRIEIPEFALVALVGASSSGKSTFAKKHFRETEILSSDHYRGVVSDDENDQSVSAAAFDLLYYAANKRLDLMKMTVIDATNVRSEDRKKILEIAREQNVHSVAIVLNLPERILQDRNMKRPDRTLPENVIRRQTGNLKKSIKRLKREGFRFVYVLNSQEEIDDVQIVRTPLWNNRKNEHGPFDIIGDIHGCYAELTDLLGKLGYVVDDECGMKHPEGRRAAFLGDLCDRGPENVKVLKLVMDMVQKGDAVCVPGNHDVKLFRYLSGKNVKMSHGLDKTIAELDRENEEFREKVKDFINSLVSHYVFDDGNLVICHAGIKEEYIGRGSGRIRDFCLYGETTGENDEYGLPVRLDWAADYRGKATIVYGHIPQLEVQKVNRTYCIDTGCVFGGKLSAFRYPEKEIVSVDAGKEYYAPIKPLDPEEIHTEDVLNAADVTGKMFIHTDLMPAVHVSENNAAAAFEIMSRFAADPRWLIYLPPTMSPCETSSLEEYLEHPYEAFDYYRSRGVEKVVCERKHMGSRAVIVICKDSRTAKDRFGIDDGTKGIIYTRTGRHFFDDKEVEQEVIDRLVITLEKSGFWADFETDWACFDTELMPWSEKAQVLLRKQYAPVGRAGSDGLKAVIKALEKTCERENAAFEVAEQTSGQNIDPEILLNQYREKESALEKYVEAYREYCWKVERVDDLRIAPFHILACEAHVFSDKDHVWHMDMIRRYCIGSDEIFLATDFIEVDVNDEASVEAGLSWWLSLTGSGGEGMVVKPFDFIAKRNAELLQPAVKCRGPEYLRIIYGPEYLMPEHLKRLKKRSLSRKRSLALREFSLGLEALNRFVAGEPLFRVHECVFGVLAFESEPVDPRL